jgi:hypothetical protein
MNDDILDGDRLQWSVLLPNLRSLKQLRLWKRSAWTSNRLESRKAYELPRASNKHDF